MNVFKNLLSKFSQIALGLSVAITPNVFAGSFSGAKFWGDYTIPIKDLYGAYGYLGFKNANDNNRVAIKQFQGRCDLMAIHVANERKDHCNNTIQLRIWGTAYMQYHDWDNTHWLVFDAPDCEVKNDSWANQCTTSDSDSTSNPTTVSETTINATVNSTNSVVVK